MDDTSDHEIGAHLRRVPDERGDLGLGLLEGEVHLVEIIGDIPLPAQDLAQDERFEKLCSALFREQLEHHSVGEFQVQSSLNSTGKENSTERPRKEVGLGMIRTEPP